MTWKSHKGNPGRVGRRRKGGRDSVSMGFLVFARLTPLPPSALSVEPVQQLLFFPRVLLISTAVISPRASFLKNALPPSSGWFSSCLLLFMTPWLRVLPSPHALLFVYDLHDVEVLLL